jgi:hypothetical protein
LGSARVKAAHRTLMKLTPRQQSQHVAITAFNNTSYYGMFEKVVMKKSFLKQST